jgi:hypothetical protein
MRKNSCSAMAVNSFPLILSPRNNLNMGKTFVDRWINWHNQILTIVMWPEQMCYPDLDYLLWINSEYGLFFCLPEINDSCLGYLQ